MHMENSVVRQMKIHSTQSDIIGFFSHAEFTELFHDLYIKDLLVSRIITVQSC